MTSIPYAAFFQHAPVVEKTSVALVAAGRCRIYPLTCSGGSVEPILDGIYRKTLEQASVDETVDDDATREENKKLKKKYMKQSVAMAQDLLEKHLQLDPSIVDVEIVLEPDQILATDGYFASCFLDAGCDKIVVPIRNADDIQAIDAARVPSGRLIALIPTVQLFMSMIEMGMIQNSLASLTHQLMICISHDSLPISSVTINSWKNTLLPWNLHLHLEIPCHMTESLQDMVSALSTCNVTCSLLDPSASQLGMAIASCIQTDRTDRLYATVVCTRSGEALGLVYSSIESIIAALECGRGVYYSRSRHGLWRKGDTSGHYQDLHRIDVDCDGDALRFTVTQQGGSDGVRAFCHLNTLTCWGPPRGVRHLQETLSSRLMDAPPGSYTKRLLEDEILLRDKLLEEAQELSEATEPKHVAEELADVLYFSMVKAVKSGVSIDDVVAELDRRARKVTRRQGDSKAFRIAAAQAILQKTPKP
jgi:phosphoribosyl-ATP pyrophosphohydrolase/phosphoribosyl-AMP cyclohydrolase/histidinol dehydrogenase